MSRIASSLPLFRHQGQLITLLILGVLATALAFLHEEAWQWNGDPSRGLYALGTMAFFCLASWWHLKSDNDKKKAFLPIPTGEATAEHTSMPAQLPVYYASQTGTAEMLAKQTAQLLQEAGITAQAYSLETLDHATLARLSQALFIASTTDEGDPPYPVAGFVRRVLGSTAPLAHLRYAVLALGDDYYEDFCAFGRRLDTWLDAQGAQPLFPRVDVNDSHEATLKQWFEQVAHALAIAPPSSLPSAPVFQDWRLEKRVLLNPGSQGEPVFHLVLVPASGKLPHWTAGAIAEVLPQHADATVQRWLASAQRDGSVLIEGRPLAEHLTHSELPDCEASRDLDAQHLVQSLTPLRHRDFSIASLPGEGGIELLVRQRRRPDGELGIGAGWLTAHAPVGTSIALRLRDNPNFALAETDIPLILIGNGTGIAGLRALLKARFARRQHRNWLVFGERQAHCDFHYQDEWEWALSKGRLHYLDLAFSRDTPERLYVQHCLDKQQARLREWVEEGAAIYVCGSLDGMASGVDASLRHWLSDAQVQTLIETGRYRRDVY